MFLGEEIGWRGFLNAKLVALVGRRGYLLGGAIWALWHLPMILGFGLNYPAHPWLGLGLFVGFCTAVNLIFARLYERSKSIIPIALAHGVLNWVGTTAFDFILDFDPNLDLFFGPTGLIGLVVLVPVAVWLYRDAA